MHPKDIDSLLEFAKQTSAALGRLCAAIDKCEERITAMETRVDSIEQRVGRIERIVVAMVEQTAPNEPAQKV